MSASELARFLARVALDDELRALAATDLDRAIEGFALEARHVDALRRGGPDVLELLGEAWRGQEEGAPAPEPSPAEPARRLPPIGLTLRLQPFATGGDDLALKWAASIVPDGAPEPVIDPAPGTPLPPLRLRVAVTPLTEPAEGGLRVRFATEVRAEGVAEPLLAPVAAPGAPMRYHPWDHRLGTPAVREAAAAVRQAAPGERRERILALIRAMETR